MKTQTRRYRWGPRLVEDYQAMFLGYHYGIYFYFPTPIRKEELELMPKGADSYSIKSAELL